MTEKTPPAQVAGDNPLQVCAGHTAGCEAAVHAMTTDTFQMPQRPVAKDTWRMPEEYLKA